MFRGLRWTAAAVVTIVVAAPAHSEHRLTASESRQQVKQSLDEASLRTARANRFGQQQLNTPAMSAFGETADQRPDGARPWIPNRAGSNYSNELENRALKMFPSIGQDAERQQWIADHEQRANEAVRTGKPVVHDVTDDNIGPPPGRLAAPPDTNYGPELEARAQRMFGLGQTREKEEWMADQKQRAIENEINRTKPLVYPVGGR